jgi:hypothetical protein
MQVLYIPFFSWIFGLDVGDGIAALDLEGDGLSGHEDLHLANRGLSSAIF